MGFRTPGQGRSAPLLVTVMVTVGSFMAAGFPAAAQTATPASAASAALDTASQRALLNKYCVTCHNPRSKSGNLVLDTIDVSAVGTQPGVWEKVVRKLRAGLMPPVGQPRPDESTYDAFVASIESELDRSAAAAPDPG